MGLDMTRHLSLFLGATACVAAAFGVNWFDAGVANLSDWPSDGQNKIVQGVGAWTNTAAAVLSGEAGARRLQLGATAEKPLEFEPLASRPAEQTVSIEMNVRFSAGPLPDTVDPQMKGAVTVVENDNGTHAWYGLVKGEGTANVWVPLTGAVPSTETDTRVQITVRVVEGVRRVRYVVDGVSLQSTAGEWAEIVFPEDSSDIVAVGCFGSGEIGSLVGTTETAALVDLTIPAITGMTVASVTAGGVEIAGENGVYAVPKGDALTVTFAPADGYVLGNPTMSVTMTASGELPAEGRPVAMLAKDVISINEIMASNGETLTTENGGAELDWVELRNTSDYDVDLTGWYLYDDPTKKQSKWEKIQGNGVIPAHGCKVVWADKDYLGFSANEAYTRIGLSTSGEPLFLATPKGTKIQQIDNFGKQIKDISCGVGALTRTLLGEASPAFYRLGSGAWTAAEGPIGMSAAESGFTVVAYKINQTINNIDNAEVFLANPATWTQAPVTNTAETIAFNDADSNAKDFTYGAFPGVNGDNFILVVTGSVYIPRAGLWTFSCGSDDGFAGELSRLGTTWTWENRAARGHAQTYSTFSLPAAGVYDLRLVYFEKSGGASLDLSVAEGEHEFTDGGFKLVGSVESGVVHAGALGGKIAVDLEDAMKGVTDRVDWKGTFTLEAAPTEGDAYRLRIRYADGFTAKVNGTTVATVTATGARAVDAVLAYSYFDIPASCLVDGENLLEVTGVNNAVNDGNFFLSPEVQWIRPAGDALVYFENPTPGVANGDDGRDAPTPEVQFSEPHGYKTEAFELTLSCLEDPSAEIHYTLDGTSPTVKSPLYTGPISISKTTVVRAAVPDADSIHQSDTSATYLFLADILTQDANPPAGFPASLAVNNQKLVYGMRQATVSNSYDRIVAGFTNSVSTISLVIDPANLFDPAKGIYVNATGNGRAWERPVMVEQISPTNTANEFSVPAGLRIRGAFSRDSKYPKHSFRLFFRSTYGMSKLSHALFGKDGADSFQKIDLRTSQNYSWANGDSGSKFTLIEDVFARDSQRDLGQPYNRSRYYNLFINGVYWGIYQTEERVDGDYASSYCGGDAADYDTIRTSQPGYTTDVVEGTTEAWENFWNMTVNQGYGASFPNNYKKAMGLNPDGTRNPDYPIYLNPTNIVAYVLTAHFAGDRDSPASSTKANNIAAFRNRVDGSGTRDGFVFNRHDAEHSLYQGYDNTTLYGTDIGPNGANFLKQQNFNPAEINYKLLDNSEYKMFFADYVYRECLKAGGQMTAPVAEARFRARMTELDDVIACEAARWGAGKTRDNWLTACNNNINFITNRVPKLISQYRANGWYPSIDASRVLSASGTQLVTGDQVPYGEKVYLSGGAMGTVYYTTDGSDPRQAGGTVSSSATAYAGTSSSAETVPLVSSGATWKYYDMGGAEPAANWMAADYADASWLSGKGSFGFGSLTYATPLYRYLNHATNGTQVTTFYFRRSFTVSATAASQATTLEINANYDDGYVLYVNGVEVDRANLPTGTIAYGTFASSAVNNQTRKTTYTLPAGLLQEGENVVAVEVHQCNATSSDILWNLSLACTIPAKAMGGLSVSDNGLTLNARVLTAAGEWSALETVELRGSVEPTTSSVAEALRVAEVMSSTADGGGDGREYLVLTNITAKPVALKGVHFTAAKSGKTPSLDLTLPEDVGELAAGASLTLTKAADWPAAKITNGRVEMHLYDAGGLEVQTLTVDASWWNSACDGTGASFLALDFGATVTDATQWKPSFLPNADATVKDSIAAAVAANDAIRLWLNGLAATESGAAAVTAFAGTTATLQACYLLGVTPETEPEIEVGIPFIALDADGKVQISGSLKLHGIESARTVNGVINLYHAPTLEALPTSTDMIPLGTSFPVQKQTLDALAPSASRFFKLKVEAAIKE